MSAAGRARTTMLTVALAALSGAAPPPVQAQSQSSAELRARQLEVFEELLTRTVKEHVDASVIADFEQQLNGEGAGTTEGPESDPVVVKVGEEMGAHGLYIAGYGVLFSIQQPQISVLPRTLAVYLNEPRGFAFGGAAPTGARPRLSGQMGSTTAWLQFQAGMIQRQLREMERSLELHLARDPESARVTEITRHMEGLRAELAGVQEQFEQLASETPAEAPEPAQVSVRVEAAEAESAERAARVRAVEAPPVLAPREPILLLREMADRQETMNAVLERNHVRVRDAVNDAAIDTLAHYGAVIKGLGDEDRLSVLVLPPNPWGFARMREPGPSQQEYVISVRYRDIRDFDSQRIDFAEFRERVRIHDRLGLELPHEGR